MEQRLVEGRLRASDPETLGRSAMVAYIHIHIAKV